MGARMQAFVMTGVGDGSIRELDRFEPAPADVVVRTLAQRHQQRILKFYGFSPFDARTEAALGAEITTMARIHLEPRLIFDRCVDFLIQRRVPVPKAGTLFELIRAGLHERKAEPVAQMDAHPGDEVRGLSDDLFTAPDEQNRYRLTLLKKLSQSTKPTRIKGKRPVCPYSPKFRATIAAPIVSGFALTSDPNRRLLPTESYWL